MRVALFALCVPVIVWLLAVAARRHFDAVTENAVQQMFAGSQSTLPPTIAASELDELPAVVRRWLLRSGVVGQPRTQNVRLRQLASLRTSPNGPWMPVRAEQWFRVDEPGFIWDADVRMFGFLPLAGRDSYFAGTGQMRIEALALVPIVNASDEKIRQGTLLRYLAEMVWFPSAALSPHVRWEALGVNSARATLSDRGSSVSGVFEFDSAGRVYAFSARRYLGSGPQAKQESWKVRMSAWSELHGMTIPVQGDVMWDLAAGPFDCYRWRITEIEYNARPARAAADASEQNPRFSQRPDARTR